MRGSEQYVKNATTVDELNDIAFGENEQARAAFGDQFTPLMQMLLLSRGAAEATAFAHTVSDIRVNMEKSEAAETDDQREHYKQAAVSRMRDLGATDAMIDEILGQMSAIETKVTSDQVSVPNEPTPINPNQSSGPVGNPHPGGLGNV